MISWFCDIKPHELIVSVEWLGTQLIKMKRCEGTSANILVSSKAHTTAGQLIANLSSVNSEERRCIVVNNARKLPEEKLSAGMYKVWNCSGCVVGADLQLSDRRTHPGPSVQSIGSRNAASLRGSRGVQCERAQLPRLRRIGVWPTRTIGGGRDKW